MAANILESMLLLNMYMSLFFGWHVVRDLYWTSVDLRCSLLPVESQQVTFQLTRN